MGLSGSLESLGDYARWKVTVIRLTRLNSHALTINSDLIKFIENAPDTVLTLTTGEKVVVRESTEEVLQRIVTFRRSVLAGLLAVGTDPNTVAVLSRSETAGHSDVSAGGEPRG